MSAHGAPDVEFAAELEQEAQALLDSGHGGPSLVLAIDQLRADRASGESLTAAIRRLRDAIEEEQK